MATTTIRVDTDTHARLQALSRESGRSLVDTIRDATEALGRQRFAYQVAGELAELRKDESTWKAYLAEAESTSVTDGIDQ
jgi:predicted DNA-binding protein